MRFLLFLGGLLFVTTVALAIATAPDTPTGVVDRWQVVENRADLEMLGQHDSMMGQMRASMVPQMETIMQSDPMRTGLSHDMIRAMEQNQAQIDRMLGRR